MRSVELLWIEENALYGLDEPTGWLAELVENEGQLLHEPQLLIDDSIKRPWPLRYGVLMLDPEPETYTVTTWLDVGKAAALAIVEHTKRHDLFEDFDFDVAVGDLGPAPSDSSGLARMEEGDLVDHYEW